MLPSITWCRRCLGLIAQRRAVWADVSIAALGSEGAVACHVVHAYLYNKLYVVIIGVTLICEGSDQLCNR